MSTSFPRLRQGSQSLSSLVKHSVEPFVSAATLFAVAWFNDEVIDDRYFSLAFLILVITFPGEWPRGCAAGIPQRDRNPGEDGKAYRIRPRLHQKLVGLPRSLDHFTNDGAGIERSQRVLIPPSVLMLEFLPADSGIHLRDCCCRPDNQSRTLTPPEPCN